MSGELTTSKSWLQRPEGKFGTVVTVIALAVAGGFGLYFWGVILPWIIMMLTNTLTALALCAGIGAIAVVAFDPRWRNLLWYGYKSLMRAMTALFIEIDPIGILKTYVESLTKKLEQQDESISDLSGQIRKIKELVAKNEDRRVHSLELMQEAQKHGNEARNAFVLQSRQAGRLEKSNITLKDMQSRMETLLRVLQKMRSASAMMVEDIKGEVEVKTQERAALLAGYGAFTAAKKILQGGGDEREMFDATMEHLADDYGMKMGEIENFMDISKGFIQGVDLENGVFEANALSQLEAWEQKSNALLSNPPANGVRVDVGSAGIPALPAPASDFAELFDDTSSASTKTGAKL